MKLYQDTLTDIQIYFPENIYSTYTNQVEILIYENLNNDGKILSPNSLSQNLMVV